MLTGVIEMEVIYMDYRELCLHDYEIIEKEVYHDTETYEQYGTIIEYTTITGYIMVYCRKCLDIQVREVE